MFTLFYSVCQWYLFTNIFNNILFKNIYELKDGLMKNSKSLEDGTLQDVEFSNNRRPWHSLIDKSWGLLAQILVISPQSLETLSSVFAKDFSYL